MILHRIFEKTVQEIFYDKICNLSVRRTDGMWKVPTLLPFPQLKGYHQADQLSRDFFVLSL